ncbi:MULTISPECIES: molecular chaperone HtpG [Arthrospira]|jgi:molecular chaperone HtpG|uniref:Heat shock protein HtpG n=2 Tax=Limnospira platensis TaxID=118562 RepID=A0A5M3TDT7_LIMPL|nr:molecular chaperone HtpG [Arthrospira platensis]AMW28710.1 molecular chaperone Hsp90 [Arthrospira platensis YZ]KDR56207.1 molecular chaperone Hsp90 [Arthrospira platensis str. Paraca]MBD2670398.1 molecular chaperone HtpG [Arthrospira platensis FACHB-439]MDF2210437.1 molecular chaperone HtpG [Arthrospira platensis NCB002]MDT9183548.1 molecular chaperone HtpG [Limnospira sp. PMC 289.06]MDT9295546.1 molecular chaperone HtpG [Arthrospira platensis PCC 7345]MDT9311354.1 molecular chaperone Htp
MTVLEQGTITIHTENIFPIIKKSLYTDHEVFLRELVSNAVDAIAKLKMVARTGEYSGDISNPEITIAIDKDAKTLSVSDTGIGLTADEIKKYINQVAFSSAEEFIQKYQATDGESIIGHFGLGFYSSFMVAKQVEIDTLSYKEGAEAVHWTCDGSPEFKLEDSARTTRGTTVTLTLMDDELEYLETSRIQQLIKTYCDFMPVPIIMDGETINRHTAPWRESPNNLTKEDYLDLYRYLYPFQEEPLLWVHLNTDYPFIVNGILYFPKLRPDVDVTQGNIKLFCNQVFVSDHCEEIIPKFLMPLRGVIDSTDIPLNISRSALQTNRTVRKIADYIAKKVGDRLKEVYRDNRQEYIRCWQDVGTFIKFGSLNDDKFKKQVEEILIFRSTYKPPTESGEAQTPEVQVQSEDGDVWEEVKTEKSFSTDEQGRYYTTLSEYLERNKSRHENRVFYCTDEAAQSTYIELHKSQGLEVLFLDSFIDTHFISFLEREHSEVKFLRVDSELDETLIEKDKPAEIVDPKTNKTRSEQIKELFEKSLNKPRVNIRTESLKSEDTPPAMVLLPEAMRRLQDMTALLQQQKADFPEDHILLVNTAHPLIQNLTNLSQGSIIQAGGSSPSEELAKMICHHVYDLALMAQKGFDAEGMKDFVERSNHVLTRLTERAM